MSNNKEDCISLSSQEKPFPCCFCGKTIKPKEMYVVLGCHPECAGGNKTTNEMSARIIDYQAMDGKWYKLEVADLIDPRECQEIERLKKEIIEMLEEFVAGSQGERKQINIELLEKRKRDFRKP